jgi:hypothetical protein
MGWVANPNVSSNPNPDPIRVKRRIVPLVPVPLAVVPLAVVPLVPVPLAVVPLAVVK